MAGVTALIASLVPSASAASAGAQLVPGLASLNQGSRATVLSISCPSAGNCAAGGSYTSSGSGAYPDEQAFVATEVNGIWGSAQEVAGTLNAGNYAAVNSVSCSSAGNCVAGGDFAQPRYQGAVTAGQAFVATEVNGIWGSAQEVAGTLNKGYNAEVYSVSCSSDGNCVAAGSYNAGSPYSFTEAFVVNEVNGIWGSAQEVAANHNTGGGAAVNSVSCSSAGTCVAAGYYTEISGTTQAFVDDEENGTWMPVQEVAANLNAVVGGGAWVYSVSCPSDGNCAAGGYYTDSSGNYQAFVVNEVNGSWGGATEVAENHNAGGDAQVNSVSCSSDGNCVAAGYYTDSSNHTQAFVANEVNGNWGSAQEVAGTLNAGGYAQVSSVSCSSDGNCVAGGYYAVNANGVAQSFSVVESSGTWSAASLIPGLSSLTTGSNQGSLFNAVSCPTTGTCAAGGAVGTSYFGGTEFAVVGQGWVIDFPPTQVSSPLNVTAVRGASWLRATWSATPNALGYQCTLLTGIGVPSSFVLRTATPSCTFLGLDRTTAYGVEVSAIATTGRSTSVSAWPVSHEIVCVRAARHLTRVGVYPVCPAGFRMVSSS